jgi:ABC-2 type transport system permease protein
VVSWWVGGGTRESATPCSRSACCYCFVSHFLWIGIYIGLVVKSPEALGAVWGLLFPVTMLTNAFVAPELMPDWLGTIAEWNPISSTVSVTRELFGNAGASAGGSWIAENAMMMAIVWPLLIVVVTLPLAVRRYQSLGR